MGWLVIRRRPRQKIIVAGAIEISVNWIKGQQVSLAVKAPDGTTVDRAEELEQSEAPEERPKANEPR